MRRLYGSGPLHLVVMLVALGFAAYATYAIFQNPRPWSVLLWLAAMIVVHDFVVLPLYTAGYRLLWRLGRVGRGKRRRVPVIHHVVVPAAVSALALLVSLPLVLRLSTGNYVPTTGMSPEPFLGRWLALSAALFAGSGLLYALRWARLRRPPEAEGAERVADEPAEGAQPP